MAISAGGSGAARVRPELAKDAAEIGAIQVVIACWTSKTTGQNGASFATGTVGTPTPARPWCRYRHQSGRWIVFSIH
jgi:hypothetical protein